MEQWDVSIERKGVERRDGEKLLGNGDIRRV